MSSKEDILKRIHANTRQQYDMPDLSLNAIVYEDKLKTFIEVLKAAGGEVYVMQPDDDLNAVIRRFYPEAQRIGSNLNEITCATFNPDELESITDNIIQFESAENIDSDNVISDITRNIIEEFTQKITDGNITAKEFINEFAQLSARPDINKHELSHFIKSEEFTKIINEAIHEQYFIKPEDITNVNIKKLYAKIINDASSMNGQFGNNSGMTAMLDSMNNASSDAQFLNNLNQFMNFVQLPVRMAGKNAHGDLYVYSRRGSKTASPDEIKALLHLDMDNLGPMDVLVKLKQKNVTTNFKVADDKILQYVEEHMDELTARLNKLGYNVDNVIELNTTPYTFKSSVIENELPPTQIKRLSFDVRA